jgi:hypothetical protein
MMDRRESWQRLDNIVRRRKTDEKGKRGKVREIEG